MRFGELRYVDRRLARRTVGRDAVAAQVLLAVDPQPPRPPATLQAPGMADLVAMHLLGDVTGRATVVVSGQLNHQRLAELRELQDGVARGR